MSRAQDLIRWALRRVGAPYLWAGKGRLKWTVNGMVQHGLGVDVYDCSGLVTCGLDAIGGPDWRATHSAGALWRALEPCPRAEEFGSLKFYGPAPGAVSHVAICLGNSLVLEAGGGDRSTTSLTIAARQGARVRVVFDGRRDYLGARMLPALPPHAA